MLPPPCECCDECTLFIDDYSTDRLATDYDTRSGSWNVTGGEVQTASGSALLIADVAYGSETACYAIAVIQCINVADNGRVVILYVDDNNYWFAEVKPGASNGTLKLYERAGGTDTQRGSTVTMTGLTAGTSVAVRICYAAGEVAAQASVGAGLYGSTHFTSSETVAGTKTGIGTGSVTTRVDFTSFLASRHGYDTEDCPACGTDCSVCAEGSMPDLDVAITFTGLVKNSNWLHCTVGCDSINGITYILPVANKAGCQNTTTFEVTGCDPVFIYIAVAYSVFLSGSDYFVMGSYQIVGDGELMQFAFNNGTTKPDCADIDITQANTFDGSSKCDPSAAFAHIVV